MMKFGRLFIAISCLVLLGVGIGNAKEKKSEKTLFSDDFSDAGYTKDNWIIKGKASLNDTGELESKIHGDSIYAGDVSWLDYILEFRFKYITKDLSGQGKPGFAGVFLRLDKEDKDKRVLVLFRVKGITYTLPGVKENNKGLMPASEIKDGEWYECKFICKGQDIEIWMNDDYKGIIKNENVPLNGGIGFWNINSDFVVDNVKVTEIIE